MADVFSSDERSEIMSRIRSKDTKPELLIRKALHRIGFRYTLHKDNLPGKPDLYFRKYNAVIEINGCFWHGHDCHYFTMPATRRNYWEKKIRGNRNRDKKNIEKLLNESLRILVIWECAIIGKTSMDFEKLISIIENWLKSEIKLMEITGSDSNNQFI